MKVESPYASFVKIHLC